LRIVRVRARTGDRLIALECSANSRFGVASSYRLVLELVPRFGNALLLKDETVVSAAREFAAGGTTRRTIARGEAYEPPPLPVASGTLEELAAALEESARTKAAEVAREGTTRALRKLEPLLPSLLAESLVAQAAAAPSEPSAQLLRENAQALLAQIDAPGAMSAPVFAYGDASGNLVQAHVFPLAQFARLELTRPAQLLPLLGDAFERQRSGGAARTLAARREALTQRIRKRLEAIAAERTVLELQRDALDERERLRHAGDALFANHGAVPPGATSFSPPGEPALRIELDPELDAKANARAIFRRYKKATARAAHATARLAELDRSTELLETLAWEAERAEADTIGEIADELARLERPKAQRAAREKPRRALEFELAEGARILVGRSPRNNAELTFRVARPGDLWFHARATPGAHVILRLDAEREPHESELTAAAQLAAFYSKARASEKVSVDYTARKFVRRRSGAAPGLVWYTNARTLLVTPKDGAAP
jgi:predicted ribosome quality control (RQC) complex YloA/Tae2 family protein